ncbi:hypothetical protein SAY87_009914 [Trapa incisa]|uniref:Uncharacterized protein n=1 Tax=Trapa incisa TaxID=236973 RepID=A0AAN7JHJ1_9MYRT|nr:hypothetical protein SAY87_009914 [Trapa incisa]
MILGSYCLHFPRPSPDIHPIVAAWSPCSSHAVMLLGVHCRLCSVFVDNPPYAAADAASKSFAAVVYCYCLLQFDYFPSARVSQALKQAFGLTQASSLLLLLALPYLFIAAGLLLGFYVMFRLDNCSFMLVSYLSSVWSWYISPLFLFFLAAGHWLITAFACSLTVVHMPICG